jgi:6-phosphogluconate dehydrogenase
MVHNGIEYGDMQMICEAYDLMKGLLGLSNAEMARSSRVETGELDSYLIEITARHPQAEGRATKRKAFVDVDPRHRRPEGHRQVDLDQRPRHGRARPDHRRGRVRPLLSAIKDERVAAAKILKGPTQEIPRRQEGPHQRLHDALYCSKICSYAQGFQLMRTAQQEYGWKLNFGGIA